MNIPFWVKGIPNWERQMMGSVWVGETRLYQGRVIEEGKTLKYEGGPIAITDPNFQSKKEEEEKPNVTNNLPNVHMTSAEMKWVKRAKAGENVEVPLSSFVDVVVATGQITRKKLLEFVDSAFNELFRNKVRFVDGEREEVQVKSGGTVFLGRTQDKQVLEAAQQSVLAVLKAIMQDEYVYLKYVNILVRGKSKFFDIRGLRAVCSKKAWLAFDLRGTS